MIVIVGSGPSVEDDLRAISLQILAATIICVNAGIRHVRFRPQFYLVTDAVAVRAYDADIRDAYACGTQIIGRRYPVPPNAPEGATQILVYAHPCTTVWIDATTYSSLHRFSGIWAVEWACRNLPPQEISCCGFDDTIEDARRVASIYDRRIS